MFFCGACQPLTAPAATPPMKYLWKKIYTRIIGTMAIVAPANIIFHAAVPSPAFFSMFTPTVRGLIASLLMVKTSGSTYSFQPCRKESSAIVAMTGLSSGAMTL